jgi:hypothetical protein
MDGCMDVWMNWHKFLFNEGQNHEMETSKRSCCELIFSSAFALPCLFLFFALFFISQGSEGVWPGRHSYALSSSVSWSDDYPGSIVLVFVKVHSTFISHTLIAIFTIKYHHIYYNNRHHPSTHTHKYNGRSICVLWKWKERW